tara:strand:+ start:94185 stop:94685 length:501 start_codon:yes stop_codon:yes gene_type:complete
MNFNLHQITPTDFNNVLELFKAAAEKIAKQQIDHWQYWKNPPIEKVNWVKEGIANNEFFFIKNTHEDLIGMVRILTNDVLYWGETNDKAYYVHSLVVIEKYEGQGIGSTVLQKIAREAKAKNFTYLRLDCDAKNPKLCAYYEKQGFVKVGEKILPLSTYNLYQKEL